MARSASSVSINLKVDVRGIATPVEMLSDAFVKWSDFLTCRALTKYGRCDRPGVKMLSANVMDPEYCIFHNLYPWRDPLGRYLHRSKDGPPFPV